jgi:tRNA1(Val) A37 N6-methylase TrmN6
LGESWAALIGTAIQTLLFLGGGVVMIVRHDTALESFRKDMTNMQLDLKELTKVITKQAVQDERLTEQSKRMTLLEQRVEELRHRQGYVQSRVAESVDREY